MGFMDQFLAPFRQKKVPPTETVGVSGTPIFGGYISTPEKNANLVGPRKFETYSEIVANTAIVGAGVRLFLNLVAKPGWKVIPANESQEAVDLAEKIDAMIHGMTQPWHSVVRTAARFRFYGFSIQEWTAKKMDDGSIGLLDIEARPQYTIEQWDVDASGTVAGVIQRDPTTAQPIYLPRTKIIYLVDNSLTDSPDGLGLLRHVAESVRHLVRLEQLEGFGFESDLGGVPVARAPVVKLDELVTKGTITQAQRDAMIKGVRDFVSNRVKNPAQGLVLDSLTYTDQSEAASPSGVQQWGLEILRGDSSSVGLLGPAIERLNREIARVLGVEHLMLGGDGAGSLALSRDKTSQFATLVEGTLNELAWSFEHDLLERLRQLNGWDAAIMPTLMPESIQMRDVQDVAETLALLAQAGAPLMPGDPAVDEVRAQLKISPVPSAGMARDASLMSGDPQPPAIPGADTVEAAGAASLGDAVQQTAFNGAQISSMVDIVSQVGAGTLSRESAIEIISTMFPVTRDQAMSILTGKLGAPEPRILNKPPAAAEAPADMPGNADTGQMTDAQAQASAATAKVAKLIRRDASGWTVYSGDGTKRLGGPYATEAEALARLRQVEQFKGLGELTRMTEDAGGYKTEEG